MVSDGVAPELNPPVDRDRASKVLATLTDHAVSVSLEFRFADTGEVSGIDAPARWGTFGGGHQQPPWEGHSRNHQPADGILAPTEADVVWYVGGEWQSVWNGIITSFEAHAAN